ncbi:outer membrane protein [Devosia sp.]|jgi:opacity protein-like surface antigen|uniref:outer membrane protein n=1 Tax=Devosia sp. TaxID=1871048 RepID=UPI003F708CFA
MVKGVRKIPKVLLIAPNDASWLKVIATALSLLVANAATSANGDDGWTGFYAGVGVTRTHAFTDVVNRDVDSYHSVEWANLEPGPENDPFRLDVIGDGTLLGLTGALGYGVDAGPLWIGLEGGVELSSALVNGGVWTCSGDLCAVSGNASKLQRLGHARALVGVPLSREVMLFVSGGVSLANATATTYSSAALYGQVDDEVVTTQQATLGTTLGIGADFRLSPGFRFRIEGLVDRYAPVTHSAVTETRVEDGWEAVGASADESFDLIAGTGSLRLSTLWEF